MKKIVLIIVTIIFAVPIVQAQQSIYEKKLEDITRRYLALLHYDKSVNELSKQEKPIIDKMICCPHHYGMHGSWQGEIDYGYYKYAQRHGKDAAEKIDYKYEKEVKEALKLRTKEERLKNRDISSIFQAIEAAFNSWAKKGEFEKSADCQKRIQNESQRIFVDLCYIVISDFISEMQEHQGNFLNTIGKYDSEKECFYIDDNEFNVPINRAKDYADEIDKKHIILYKVINRDPFNWCCVDGYIYNKTFDLYELKVEYLFDVGYNYSKKKYNDDKFSYLFQKTTDGIRYYRNNLYRNDGFFFVKEQLEDKYISLNKYSQYSQEEDSVRLLYTNCLIKTFSAVNNIRPRYDVEDIIIYFDDLDIDNPYLKGSAFNYTKEEFIPGPYYKKQVEHERKEVEEKQKEEELLNKQRGEYNLYNDMLQNIVNAYNKQLQEYPYDYQTNAISCELPEVLIGNTEALQDTLNILIESIKNKQQLLVETYKIDSTIFSGNTKLLQTKINEVNKELLSYPFNTTNLTISDSLPMSLFGKNLELSELVEQKIKDLPIKRIDLEQISYENLHKNSPKQFVDIWFSQTPNSKLVADSLYIECRCNYDYQLSFYIDFIDEKLYNCDCRNKSYNELGSLYDSRDEFDKSYNQDETKFNEEITERQVQFSELEKLNTIIQENRQFNLKKARVSNKDDVISVLNKILYHKDKYFYGRAIESLFTHNEKLSKEWAKYGSYFNSQKEMFEIYIGENYDKEIKQRKKE